MDFYFPKKGISVKADSLEDALKLLNKPKKDVQSKKPVQKRTKK